MKHEKHVRMYANHLALTTRKHRGVISLFWRYGDRRKLGEYRSWKAVDQALQKITPEDLKGNRIGGMEDIVIKEAACVLRYNEKDSMYGTRGMRGWWVREYHSDIAMKQHLKGKKGFERSYGESGPFRTEKEAREYARECI